MTVTAKGDTTGILCYWHRIWVCLLMMRAIVVSAKTVSAKGFRCLQIGMGLFLPLLERIFSHWEELWKSLWPLQKDLTVEAMWSITGTQRPTTSHFLPCCQILHLSTNLAHSLLGTRLSKKTFWHFTGQKVESSCSSQKKGWIQPSFCLLLSQAGVSCFQRRLRETEAGHCSINFANFSQT